MGKPSREQLTLQMELQRLQNARRLDEEEFDNQKQVLQAQLQNEVRTTMPGYGLWEAMPSGLFSPLFLSFFINVVL